MMLSFFKICNATCCYSSLENQTLALTKLKNEQQTESSTKKNAITVKRHYCNVVTSYHPNYTAITYILL